MFKSLYKTRWPYVLIIVACVGLLAFAYYAQFVLELSPCPMCMLQRFGFMIMAVAALGLALHHPQDWKRWLYGVPFLGGAIWGIVTATQHVRLQNAPSDPMGGCGADWPTMMAFDFSWSEILTEAFTASGDCAQVSWTFLGLSMPAWTLIWYVGLTLFILPALFRRSN